MTGVNGIDAGKPAVTIPSYITTNGGPTTASASAIGKNDSNVLSETDYSGMSGWMYTVNHAVSGQGLAQYTLQDGDVLRIQFTVWGYGADLGVAGLSEAQPYYVHADKTALIRALYADGAIAAAKPTALGVVIDPLATEAQVDAAYYALTVDEGSNLRALTFANNAQGTTKFTPTEPFVGATYGYKLILNSASNLFVNPQKTNTEDYQWKWIATNRSTGAVTSSGALDFNPAQAAYTKIGTTTVSVGAEVEIQVLDKSSGAVLQTYEIEVLPRAVLSALTAKYGTLANQTWSPALSLATTYNYTTTLSRTVLQPQLAVTPNTSVATHSIKINGQTAPSNTAFTIADADLGLDQNPSYQMTITVEPATEGLYEPTTYTITVLKPSGVSISADYMMNIKDRAVFFDSTGAITPLTFGSATNFIADSPVTFQWYKNDVNSTVSGTAIDGATSFNYAPAREVGVNYYYGVVTSQSGKTYTSAVAAVKVIPNEEPDIIVNTPGDTLPQVNGVTWPEGVTKGYYYTEDTDPQDYAPLSLSPTFYGQEWLLDADPWNCTFSYTWKRTNALTGVAKRYSGSTSSTIYPEAAIGGWYYTCDVQYKFGTLSSATYTSAPVYVHIEDPAVEAGKARELGGLSLAGDGAGKSAVGLEPAFDGGVNAYAADSAPLKAPDGYSPGSLYAKPEMDDAANYRWIYSVTAPDGKTTFNNIKREFDGQFVKLAYLSQLSDANSMKIKIVGAGDDDTVYGAYAVDLLPRADLNGLALSGAASLMSPSSYSDAVTEYRAYVDRSQETITINITNGKHNYVTSDGFTKQFSHKVTVNGQASTADSITFTLNTADLTFVNGESVVTIDVESGYTEGRAVSLLPNSYRVILKEFPSTLKLTAQSLPGYGEFYGSASAPQPFSVTAASIGGDISYTWYKNELTSPSAVAEAVGTDPSYTPTNGAIGVFQYYCVVSNGTDSLQSDAAMVKVYPAGAPELTVLTPGDDLPEITGVTYPDGVTKGFYYTEETDPKAYTNLRVGVTFAGGVDLSAAPWNATVALQWSAQNMTGGATPSLEDRASLEIAPLRVIGGCSYSLRATVYSASYASVVSTSDPVYVHIQNPRAIIEGSGSADDPYRIGTAEQLAAVRKDVSDGNPYTGKYLKLTDDIALPDDWTPIGGMVQDAAFPFSGVFDGDGHTITYAYGSKALFGYVNNATISALSIRGEYIADNGLVAVYTSGSGPQVDISGVTIKNGTTIRNSGLAGGEGTGTINVTDCVIESDVKIGYDADKDGPSDDLPHYSGGFPGGPGVGGFVSGLCGSVSGCVNYGTVYGHSQVGGIVGFKAQAMRGCAISDCVFAGTIIADGNFVGGILGAGYNEQTGPNSPCGKVYNCYSVGTITGNNKVGGILGAEPNVISAWANGPGLVQNNYFAGQVTATRADKNDPNAYHPGLVYNPGGASDDTYVGGIVGYLRGINNNNTIKENYFLEGRGATRALGGTLFVDTTWYQKQEGWTIADSPTNMNGARYFCSEVYDGSVADKDGLPPNSVVSHSLAGRLPRNDDPLGGDAATLGRSVSAAELKDSTVVTLLNEGEKSSHNWIQGENYPIFGTGLILYKLELGGSYKTQYTKGDALDTSGMEFTATYGDESTKTIPADDVKFTGFDSEKVGTQTVTAGYRALTVSFEVTVAASSQPLPAKSEVKTLLDSVMSYQLKRYTKPVFGTEWTVMGLARGGYLPGATRARYLDNLVQTLQERKGELDNRRYTEYSRVIIALSALGVDARNIGGYDLTEPLAHFDKVEYQGITGLIFALIALDTGDYAMPVISDTANQATRERYIDAILSAEIKKGEEDAGGFALSGSTPDPDVTAMALQALEPYRGKGNAAVDGAVDRALVKLSDIQRPDGGYASWGTVNSESIAQVMVALNTLGVPVNDEGFVKEGPTVYDALKGFYLASGADKGGFMHVTSDGVVNGMATDQAAYALVSLYRALTGEASLYDMSDVSKTVYVNSADNADIAKAKSLVEAAAYTVNQSEAPDEAAALAKVKTLVGAQKLNGVTATVNKVSYAAATAGTLSDVKGKDGAYVFTVTLSKGAGTRLTTKDLTLKIVATSYVKLPLSAVTIKIADKQWTGKAVKSGLTITATYGSPAETVKLTTADYTLVKSGKWYKNIGKAKITVKAKGTKFTGSKTVSFKIVPKKVALRKLAAGRKFVKATWKNAAKAQKISGYQVQYRVKTAVKWSKLKNVSRTKLTYRIGKLQKGKRYYVHVRAYKKVGKARYYGPWSATRLSRAVK
jgi:hypothetical protein